MRVWQWLAICSIWTLTFFIFYLIDRLAVTTERFSSAKVHVPEPKEQQIEDSWRLPAQPSFSYPTKLSKPSDKYVIDDATRDAVSEQARQNFRMSRYSPLLTSESPFVTIVTRTFQRPQALQRNLASVRSLDDPSWEHVVLEDTKGGGMRIAEAAVFAFRDEYRGQYVAHCDDDDFISNHHMIRVVREAISTWVVPPKIIVFKIWHEPNQKFMPLTWKDFPSEGMICTNNVLVRRDIYIKPENLGVIAQHHAGDYAFIHNALLDCEPSQVCWIDQCFMTVTKNRPALSPPVVSVELRGGLGNQLFQFATAYAYAQKHQSRLVANTHRQWISPESDDSRPCYFDSFFRWVDHDERLESPGAAIVPWNHYQEPRFAFDPIPDYYGNVWLTGYFQSDAYFQDCLPALRSKFTEWYTAALDVAPHTVSMHVRLTDYVGSSLHTNQTWSDYYQPALQKVMALDPLATTVHLFSDDISKAQEWLNQQELPYGLQVIPIQQGDEKKELMEMCRCQHHIMANSSFSWWATMLRQPGPEDVVIAPSRWFHLREGESPYWGSVYCSSWIVV